VRTLLAGAAQYICLAHALQPSKDIYRKSLAVVRQMLPLPFLRAGYLTAPRARSIGSVTETYRRDWFVLDQRSLRQASHMETSLSTAGAGARALPTQPHQLSCKRYSVACCCSMLWLVNQLTGCRFGHTQCCNTLTACLYCLPVAAGVLSSQQRTGVAAAAAGTSAAAAAAASEEEPLVLPLSELLAVRRCAEPSLPQGAGIWVSTQAMPTVSLLTEADCVWSKSCAKAAAFVAAHTA
jgi:hypothetical protein